MNTMGNPKPYILFDIGGVLFNNGVRTFFKELANDTGKDPLFVEETLKDREALRLGNETLATYWNRVGKSFGLTADEAKEKWFSCYTLDQAMMRYALALKQQGYHIGLQSNTFAEIFEYMDTMVHFREHFSPIFLSYELKCTKPNRAYYEHMIKTCNTNPHQIHIIDDKVANIQTAKSMGMHAYLYQGYDHLKQALQHAGISVT